MVGHMALQYVTIIDLCDSGGPEAHGLSRLIESFEGAGVRVSLSRSLAAASNGTAVIVGRGDRTLVKLLADEHGYELPVAPETTFLDSVQIGGRHALLVSGGDAAGVMYAALELADRVRREGVFALSRTLPLHESPTLRVRGVNRFIMGHLDDAWFHSDEFWGCFLDTLARSRLNRFVFITGFDTAYMSPPYPYFVEVPGFPNVGVKALTSAGQAKNLRQLRRIGQLCADRAIDFYFGIWQQVPWQREQSSVVDGLPPDEDALARYCAAGLRRLVVSCPEIVGVHLRVNHEAGVGTQTTAEGFWNTLTDAVAVCGRPVKLDLRAKGLTDSMIDHALAHGLDVSVPTKYWCEQTGLPHHLTRMRTEELARLDNLNHSRRYSYSNLLRTPRSYDMIYRLWNLGATNLFIWGDPDYVRRYCASMQVGDASGFEIASPLSLKWGHELRHGEAWPLFEDDRLVSYRFEDERYWYLYLLFGRIGYDPACDTAVFTRELTSRFGSNGGVHVARAYAASGRIIPLITASHMPQHPMLVYWPELSTGGALYPENHWNKGFRDISYGAAEPSDPGLFYGIDEYASDLADYQRTGGSIRDKYTPLQVSAWLTACSAETRRALAAAGASEDLVRAPEWLATELDLSMLAELADYHSAKIRAALHLSLHGHTGAAAHLGDALSAMRTAAGHWRRLAHLGTGTYHDPLDFQAGGGAGRVGHWKDAIPEIEADLARLDEAVAGAGGAAPAVGAAPAGVAAPAGDPAAPDAVPGRPIDLPDTACAGGSVMQAELRVPERVRAGEAVLVELIGTMPGLTKPTVRYRHADQTEGEFRSSAMTPSLDRYIAEIPASYVSEGVDLLVYVSGRLSPYETVIAPGLYHPTAPLPYRHVRVRSRNAQA